MLKRKSHKGQLKIQEMAFVLVALMIFFAIVALFYLSIRLSQVKENVVQLREQESQEIVRKIASTPEFSSPNQCAFCIDLDKAFVLKYQQTYQKFWDLDYLSIETIYPNKKGECTKSNYPDCRTITILNKSLYKGTPVGAFAALCKRDVNNIYVIRCDIGKIYAGGKHVS